MRANDLIGHTVWGLVGVSIIFVTYSNGVAPLGVVGWCHECILDPIVKGPHKGQLDLTPVAETDFVSQVVHCSLTEHVGEVPGVQRFVQTRK